LLLPIIPDDQPKPTKQPIKKEKPQMLKTLLLLLFVLNLHANISPTTYNTKNSPTTISDKNGNSMSIVYNDYNAPRSFTTAMGATNIFPRSASSSTSPLVEFIPIV